MMSFPSFEEFAEVLLSYAGLKRDRHIGPETRLERDLNLTQMMAPNCWRIWNYTMASNSQPIRLI
jgi:hypothetical protein